jgi:hypothetical protein
MVAASAQRQLAGMQTVDNPLLRYRMRYNRSAQEEGD